MSENESCPLAAFFGAQDSIRLGLELNNLELHYEHSLSVFAEVENQAFRGQTKASFYLDDWEAFVEQLQRCEHTRRGSATLTSMSPDDFRLSLEEDGTGHFLLLYQLQAHTVFTRQGESIAQTLRGGFSLDSQTFGRSVTAFASLIPEFGTKFCLVSLDKINDEIVARIETDRGLAVLPCRESAFFPGSVEYLPSEAKELFRFRYAWADHQLFQILRDFVAGKEIALPLDVKPKP